MRRERQLLEAANVHGAWYGTPKRPIERTVAKGRSVILSIDVQGARNIRRLLGRQAVLIFLKPPSLAQLRRRLVRRSTETSEAIRRRMAVAKREMSCARWYDHTVVNDRLETAVAMVRQIVNALLGTQRKES